MSWFLEVEVGGNKAIKHGDSDEKRASIGLEGVLSTIEPSDHSFSEWTKI